LEQVLELIVEFLLAAAAVAHKATFPAARRRVELAAAAQLKLLQIQDKQELLILVEEGLVEVGQIIMGLAVRAGQD
jgi:hypothetical protein